MIEEEEMEKQVNDGMMVLSMNVPMSKMMMIYVLKYLLMLEVRSTLHFMQFKKQQNTRKKELDN